MEWIRALDESIKKWMVVEQQFELFERKHKTKPTFLSISRKEKEEGIVLVRNGAVHDHKIETSDGYTIEGYVGDKTRGSGYSFTGSERIAKVPEKLLLQLNGSLDSVLKVGLESYIDAASHQIHFNDLSVFNNLAPAPVIEEYQDFNGKQLINLPSEKQIEFMKEFSEKLSKHPRVVNATVLATTRAERKWFVNSDGTKLRTVESNGLMSWSAYIINKDSYQRFVGDNMIYNPNTNWSELNLLLNQMPAFQKNFEEVYDASTLESGNYPVIFSGKSFGTFMHEAVVAHLLSGAYISEGLAPAFEDKLGQQVMPEFLSIETVPNLPGGFGSFKYDDEGFRAKDDLLIDKGVLVNFLHDRKSAYDLDLPNNGHSRLQWPVVNGIKLHPEPRVSNTRITSHLNMSEQDLVAGLKGVCEQLNKEFGLYVRTGSGGQVDIVDGNFIVYPDEMWKVYQDGRWERTTGAKIIGSPHVLLESIIAASNNYENSYGHCGATSGYVPTQDIAPSVLIPSIDVIKEVDIRMTKRLA